MSFKSVVSVVSEQCQQIKQSLSSFPYFDTWDTDSITECCRLSSLAEFPANELILGPDSGNSHTVYFILEGVAKILHYLSVEINENPRERPRYRLRSSQNSQTSDFESKNGSFSSRLFRDFFEKKKSDDDHEEENEKMEDKKIEEMKRLGKEEKHVGVFMESGFLLKGACFGLEKCEKNCYIVSSTKVRCLKIPERFLLQHNPCNIWNRIRLFHRLYFPREKKIFDSFKNGREWAESKTKYIDLIERKMIANYTLSCDVPYSIRLSEWKRMEISGFEYKGGTRFSLSEDKKKIKMAANE